MSVGLGKAGQGPKGKGQSGGEGKGEGKGDGKGKEDKGKTRESAAVAKEDAAWMAIPDHSDSDDDSDYSLISNLSTCPTLDELLDGVTDDDNVSVTDSCPDLQQIFSDDEEDLEGGKGSEEWKDWEEDEEFIPTVNQDSGEAAYTSTFELGMLSRDGLGSDLIDIELFDSGASRHMSGHRHRFVNFTEIEARPITAADKRRFDAIGKGDMYIDVPKEDGTSRILLRDVLYAPKMGVTLISIGKITDAGSSVLFHGNVCRIFDDSRVLLAEIPKGNGLYQTYTPHSKCKSADYAAKVAEVLTIDELHRRLGHVGHEAAKILVEKGLVKGVELDLDSKPTVCASCEWGKGHRKAIQRVREDERAAAVGDEIHSDLWGPAPVEHIRL